MVVSGSIKAGDKESIIKSIALKTIYAKGDTCYNCGTALTWFISDVRLRDGASIVSCSGYCPRSGEGKVRRYAKVNIVIDDFGEVIDVQDIQSYEREECFITSAVCEFMGKSPDCYELRLLKEFRDNYVMHVSGGRELIDEYYRIAPIIVHDINKLPNKSEIYVDTYQYYLLNIIDLIESENYPEAIALYKEMVDDLRQIPSS